MMFSAWGMVSKLDEQDMNRIHKPVLNKEIRDAIFSIGALKGPWPNGFDSLFFQSQWDVVKESVW